MEIKELIESMLKERQLITAVISNRRKASENDIEKIEWKPVLLKDDWKVQWTRHTSTQVFHKNLSIEETIECFLNDILKHYKQCMFYTTIYDYRVLISKKGKIKILKKPPSRQLVDFSHNRKKRYFLQEGTPYPFLVHLGVMTPDGKVKSKRYDKFRQLNRYLEIVDDVMKDLDQPFVRIVDFGCGKAYLTFALYHYLVEILGKDVEIIGLDLKENVIDFGNETAQVLGYDTLSFVKGDIQSYTAEDAIDMVISLHACDTATDDALVKAIGWDAKIIMAVPCCQHELNPVIKSEAMTGLLKYGIYKERIAALLTDALRAGLLEQSGYSVDVLEFVSLEHSAKNLMIRAVKASIEDQNVIEEYKNLKELFSLEDFHMERSLRND